MAGPSAGEPLPRSLRPITCRRNTRSRPPSSRTLIKAYPDDNLAGNAYFYLGEVDARSARPAAAVKNFDHVLERYPDNAKVPAAHLHKGEALIVLKENEAATRELRALMGRFPNSPEAAQARTRPRWSRCKRTPLSPTHVFRLLIPDGRGLRVARGMQRLQ